jgi:hypothetical protein
MTMKATHATGAKAMIRPFRTILFGQTEVTIVDDAVSSKNIKIAFPSRILLDQGPFGCLTVPSG